LTMADQAAAAGQAGRQFRQLGPARSGDRSTHSACSWTSLTGAVSWYGERAPGSGCGQGVAANGPGRTAKQFARAEARSGHHRALLPEKATTSGFGAAEACGAMQTSGSSGRSELDKLLAHGHHQTCELAASPKGEGALNRPRHGSPSPSWSVWARMSGLRSSGAPASLGSGGLRRRASPRVLRPRCGPWDAPQAARCSRSQQ